MLCALTSNDHNHHGNLWRQEFYLSRPEQATLGSAQHSTGTLKQTQNLRLRHAILVKHCVFVTRQQQTLLQQLQLLLLLLLLGHKSSRKSPVTCPYLHLHSSSIIPTPFLHQSLYCIPILRTLYWVKSRKMTYEVVRPRTRKKQNQQEQE